MGRKGRRHSGGLAAEAQVVFCVRLAGGGGAFSEVVVAEDNRVILRRCDGAHRAEVEALEKRRRDVDEFLWRVEDLDIARWRGGERPAGEGWHVAILTRGGWVTACGSGDPPPQWDGLCRLVEHLTGEPLD